MSIEGFCHCGSVHWSIRNVPESGTVCNCSTCRRYGAIWAYGLEGDEIDVSGQTKTYSWGRTWLEFHFCPKCGCMAYWRALAPEDDGRRPMGVNLRLAPPESVREIPLMRHDTETKDDLPFDGRCVADLWF